MDYLPKYNATLTKMVADAIPNCDLEEDFPPFWYTSGTFLFHISFKKSVDNTPVEKTPDGTS